MHQKKFSSWKKSMLLELRQDKMGYLYLAVLLFLLAIISIQNWRYMEQNIVIDVSGEMRYMRKVWETGNPFTPAYAHSQELFFSRPWMVFVPLYALTHDLIVASKLTNIVVTILIVLALTYFFRQIKWTLPQVFLALMLFFGLISRYVDYALFWYFNAYSIYAIGILLTFGSLADTFKKRKLIVVNTIIQFGFAVYFGMCGVKMFLYIYAPVFFVEIITLINRRLNQKECNWFRVALSTAMLLANAFGIAIFKFVLTPYMKFENGFSTLTTIHYDKLWNDICKSIKMLAMAVGVNFEKESILSKEALTSFYMMALIGVLCWGIVFLRKKQFFSEEEKKLLCYMSVSIGAVCFFFTVTNLGGLHRHYFLISVIVVVLLVVIYRYLNTRKDLALLRYLFCLFLLIGICLVSATNYHSPEKMETNYMKLSDYLCDVGYERVAGSYEAIGRVGFLSDDRITTLTLSNTNSPQMWDWITDRTKYMNDDEPIALVLTTDENKEWKKDEKKKHLLSLAQSADKVENYYIYYYEKMPLCFDMLRFHSDARYNFLTLDYKGNTELENGGIVLKPEAMQYGPYCRLEPGTYDVVIRGENLTAGSFYVVSDSNDEGRRQVFEMHDLSVSEREAVFSIRSEVDADRLEFRCTNQSDGEITIYDITVIPRNQKPIWD